MFQNVSVSPPRAKIFNTVQFAGRLDWKFGNASWTIYLQIIASDVLFLFDVLNDSGLCFNVFHISLLFTLYYFDTVKQFICTVLYLLLWCGGRNYMCIIVKCFKIFCDNFIKIILTWWTKVFLVLKFVILQGGPIYLHLFIIIILI